jgi:predicted small lipoprotein YifL
MLLALCYISANMLKMRNVLMKKRIFLCLILALAAVLLLAGCRKTPQETLPGDTGTQPVETTETQTGPVQDSMFDDDGNVTDQTEPDDNGEESTKPAEDKNPTEATRPGNNLPESDGPVDPPDSDDPAPTNPTTKDPDPTENPGDKVEVPNPEDVDYREFMDMTPAEQQAFMESF